MFPQLIPFFVDAALIQKEKKINVENIFFLYQLVRVNEISSG